MCPSPHVLLLFFASLVIFSTTAATCRSQDPATKSRPHSQKSAPSIDEWLLFFPSKYPAGNWKPDNLRFEDVSFAAEDGTQLHGWYCPCDSPRATILIAHGNAGHVASRAGWLRLLQARLRVTTFMFDYRGYGRSEGLPTVEGVLLDARAARGKLRELAGIKESELVLMGESLGGAIAVQLAAESPPKALILQSTFSSLRDVADIHYPKLSWLVSPTKLDSRARIARYRGPLFQSHGTDDRTIPISLGEKLFQSAHEPKALVTLTGANHNDWLTEEYISRLDAFIDSLRRAGAP